VFGTAGWGGRRYQPCLREIASVFASRQGATDLSMPIGKAHGAGVAVARGRETEPRPHGPRIHVVVRVVRSEEALLDAVLVLVHEHEGLA
jgi:hypothetical protein